MRTIARCAAAALAAGLVLGAGPTSALAENLGDAWRIALSVNQGLQAQQEQSVAEAYTLRAARSARLPTVRSFNFESFLTVSPALKNTLAGSSTAAGTTGTTAGLGGTAPTLGAGAGASAGAGAGAAAALPATFPILGEGQRQLPVSISFATVPLYSGGRIAGNINAAGENLNAQKTQEFRTALDLKLTVAEAYVAVLRAQKTLEVARTSVAQLAAFARDVRNRSEQGVAIRSEVLAAEVSLANARLSEIQARTGLESARATYNRYLCRPLGQAAWLEELTNLSPDADWRSLADQAVRAADALSVVDEGQVQDLTSRAIRNRPELAGLAAQARSLNSQAGASLGNVRPQVAFTMSYLFFGNNNAVPQGIGAATFVADWTITDGGRSRRQAASLHHQEYATRKRRADTAADIALEVRTRWLDLQQARQRVPVSRLAVVQAEENVKVITDRYRQQLSTYTEVLDAETRRVTSLSNFYNALYDENLALFRLRRAVGDL